MAGSQAGPRIEIRTLKSVEEFRDAVALQKEIWGFKDVDLLPVRLFVVASKVGGHVLGGYDGERMIAFGLAIPGIKPGGKCYLHGHMLGVAAGYRNYGVGRMMKLRQRDDARPRGIELMEWTFDPLELKNAYFNIERLGAVVRRYVLNQYGTTSSKLHGGLPTDRCIAEWWLNHDRVRGLLDEGRPFERPQPVAEIAIPNDIDRIRGEEPARAREIQRCASERFIELFAQGLAVVGFEKREKEGAYLFAPWDSK